MAVRTLFMSALALLLSACGSGGEIDATNGDTLRDSLNRIVADMPEAQRQSFGQDILLLVEYSAAGIEGVSRRELYSNDYAVLFMEEGQGGMFAALAAAFHEDVVLRAGDAIHGKSPGQLAVEAKEVRSAFYTNLAADFESKISELQALADEIPAKLAKHEADANAALEQISELERNRASAVQNVRITSFVKNGSQYTVEGLVDVTNHHVSPVSNAYFELVLPMPDAVDQYISATANGLRSGADPLLPGETRNDVYFTVRSYVSITRGASVSREAKLEDGPVVPGVPEFNFTSYHRSWVSIDLKPTREQERLAYGFDEIQEVCQREQTRLENAIRSNNAHLSELNTLIVDPAPFEGQITTPPRQRVGIFGRRSTSC